MQINTAGLGLSQRISGDVRKKAKCCLFNILSKEPIMGRIWPMARDKELTAGVKHVYLFSPCVFFLRDWRASFLFRFLLSLQNTNCIQHVHNCCCKPWIKKSNALYTVQYNSLTLSIKSILHTSTVLYFYRAYKFRLSL